MGSYVPNTLEERQEMLKEIGYNSIDDLFAHIPDEVKIKGGLNIPEGKSELEVRSEMENIASKNQVFKTIFRGAGAYRHFIPSIVNSVISKENLLTAYTPYQAEISQGILQSIFEYQTMICDLTGMDVSNACVYDGAEAAAEGVAMCQERKRKKAFISAVILPDAMSTIKTYCHGNGMEIVEIPEKDGKDFGKVVLGKESASGVFEKHKDTNVYTGICRNRLEEPSLAIGGEIFHRILETCRTNMDYIILDTPPMGMTADAEELAEYADAAVLSVRQDGVLTRDINDAIDALNQKEEKVIGCVFGNVYPGFGERIGNSYGYGYGYGTYSRAER